MQSHRTLKSIIKNYPWVNIKFIWSPSHVGLTGNEMADKLAAEALNEPTVVSSTATAAKLIANQNLYNKWHKDWNATKHLPSGWQRSSHPPSLKRTKLFDDADLPREILSRFIQMTTSHCFNGEYYRRFLSDKESDLCPTCGIYETRQHVLEFCPKYANHRGILLNASKSFNLKVLTTSTKGQKALMEFMTKTGAFTKLRKPLEVIPKQIPPTGNIGVDFLGNAPTPTPSINPNRTPSPDPWAREDDYARPPPEPPPNL
jgi:hypothetical protein